jgi:hypothetical protein
MAQVNGYYIDSKNPEFDVDPDKLVYAVGLSFHGNIKEHSRLKDGMGTREAEFHVQPAKVHADMHLDTKPSVAWLRKGEKEKGKGKKIWIFFPSTTHNVEVWKVQHASLEAYLHLTGGALKKMEKGLYCIQEAGDLVYVPVGWFHSVITVEPSILIVASMEGAGSEALKTLHVYMAAMRVRHKGKNELGEIGWSPTEILWFEDAMKTLLLQLKESKIEETEVVDLFDVIWRLMAEFGIAEFTESFLSIAWNKEWKEVAKRIVMAFGGEENCHIWTNACFLKDCDERRAGGRRKCNKIKAIIAHMKSTHMHKET